MKKKKKELIKKQKRTKISPEVQVELIQFLTEGKNNQEIMKIKGWTYSTTTTMISAMKTEYGYDIKRPMVNATVDMDLVNKVKELYGVQGLTLEEIGKITNTSAGKIYNVKTTFNIKKAKIKNKEKIEKEQLYQLYLDKKITISEIAEKLGKASGVISNAISRYKKKKEALNE